MEQEDRFGFFSLSGVCSSRVVIDAQLGQAEQQLDQVHAAGIESFANPVLGDIVPASADAFLDSRQVELDRRESDIPDPDFEPQIDGSEQHAGEGAATQGRLEGKVQPLRDGALEEAAT